MNCNLCPYIIPMYINPPLLTDVPLPAYLVRMCLSSPGEYRKLLA
jgi:hypothetical protein